MSGLTRKNRIASCCSTDSCGTHGQINPFPLAFTFSRKASGILALRAAVAKRNGRGGSASSSDTMRYSTNSGLSVGQKAEPQLTLSVNKKSSDGSLWIYLMYTAHCLPYLVSALSRKSMISLSSLEYVVLLLGLLSFHTSIPSCGLSADVSAETQRLKVSHPPNGEERYTFPKRILHRLRCLSLHFRNAKTDHPVPVINRLRESGDLENHRGRQHMDPKLRF